MMMKGISVLLVLILGISTQLFGFPASETQKDKPKQKTEAAQKGNRKVKDPVCEMEIDSKSAAGKATYKGKTYYFCSVSEKEQFEKEPAKYVK
jgi:YHS domain-containing protein